MKKIFLLASLLFIAGIIFAQKYPDPEFSNEVYYLKKDSAYAVIRLEKGSSNMESRNKAAGFGGSESDYFIDGEKSPVRFINGNNLSFIFSNGTSSSGTVAPNQKRDSMMRANGMDPAMLQGMSSMSDPSNAISLYKTDPEKNKRKVILQKTPGALPFGSKKIRSSDKITFSAKKIKEGYWELVVDKPLTKGEYAFTMMNMSTAGAMGGVLLFAFGID